MRTSLVKIFTISFLLFALFIGVSSHHAFASSSYATATHFCQCVEFVDDFAGLDIQANANEWPQYLPSYGYHTNSTPQDGDILTLPAYTDGVGTFGHVAIIDTSVNLGGGLYRLTLLGANQGNSGWFSYSTCYNVNYWTMTVRIGDGSQYWY